jgi:TRAP-type C4-dicarboxylate transport system permease small subunit
VKKTVQKIEKGVRLVLTAFCGILLALMVLFTCYTVIMRYVFLNAPFWGDTLTMFSNIWMVLIALVLTVRDRSYIAMKMAYGLFPEWLGRSLELLWSTMICAFGAFLAWYGFDVAWNAPALIWELNNLSKTYPMMILPICGGLMFLAALVVIVEDVLHFIYGDRYRKMNQIEER